MARLIRVHRYWMELRTFTTCESCITRTLLWKPGKRQSVCLHSLRRDVNYLKLLHKLSAMLCPCLLVLGQLFHHSHHACHDTVAFHLQGRCFDITLLETAINHINIKEDILVK